MTTSKMPQKPTQNLLSQSCKAGSFLRKLGKSQNKTKTYKLMITLNLTWANTNRKIIINLPNAALARLLDLNCNLLQWAWNGMEIVKLNVQMNAVHGTHCERCISHVHNYFTEIKYNLLFLCVIVNATFWPSGSTPQLYITCNSPWRHEGIAFLGVPFCFT